MHLPTISIGLPVFNGERFLSDALNSLIAQTFKDFEIIICDNASTDGTHAICRAYAARDRRIRYYRQNENVGAARNYNECFRRSVGRYFKWAAHDDMIEQTFLERCLKRLEDDSSLAIVFCRMREVDQLGNYLRDYDDRIIWRGETARTRVDSLICSPNHQTYIHRCVPITGLIRSELLRHTRLIGSFNHADKVALVELAMLGNFAEIPDPLFLRRMHLRTSLAANPSPRQLARWFNPKGRHWIVVPQNRLFIEYTYSILRSRVSFLTKVACMPLIIRLFKRKWRVYGGEIKRALRQLIASAFSFRREY